MVIRQKRGQSYYIISGLGGHMPQCPPPLMDPHLVSDYVNICMQWLQSWHPDVDDDGRSDDRALSQLKPLSLFA